MSKFRFKIQPYQTDAVHSVAAVFKGQPYTNAARYTRDLGGRKPSHQLSFDELDEDFDKGFANADIILDEEALLANIKETQQRYRVDHVSDKVVYGFSFKRTADTSVYHAPALDIEMETGTGKTYCYIKTMFDLNERYGWNKFIVVVPSVAIREGVKKSFEQMEDHFMDTYGKKARYFVYDSDNLTRLDSFSTSNSIQVMIINYQAFNSTKNTNIIDTPTERFQDRRPIDVIAANRPILILDEPQKLSGKATQAGLAKFKPLFSINYSATHTTRNNLVYQLDALAAYNQFLVKKIEVKGFDIKNLKGTGKYIYLQDIILSEKEPPRVRLEFEQKLKTGEVKRVVRILGKGDNLYDKSGEMPQYAGGDFVITDIDGRDDVRSVSFKGGLVLRVKEAQGFAEEKDLRRVQIRETIVSHLDKEEQFLYKKRIKCLSLFFIDEVAKYKSYGDNGEELMGEYARIFEEEYAAEVARRLENLAVNPDYKAYLESMQAAAVHNGYFSIDKKTKRIVNSDEKRGAEGSDDISAYDLILKNKERLLDFEEPTRFIFSHSALREGWDNPNVFQICTLKQSDSSISKRQEIGRGLRICRNWFYELMDRAYTKSDSLFHKINKLTVIATDSYKDFVAAFQSEFSEVIKGKPTQANEKFFVDKLLFDAEGEKIKVDESQARAIYKYLMKHDYIDDNDHVTETFRNDLGAERLQPLPEDLQPYAESVARLVQAVYNPKMLKGMIEDGNAPKQIVSPNANFERAEFQALWQEINHKYAYQVNFDSEELIDKAVAAIDATLTVSQLAYTVTWSEQRGRLASDQVKSKDMFYGEKTRTERLESAGSDIDYDLVGKIASACDLTRRSVVQILHRISKAKFDLFKANPEEFITKVAGIIDEQKATTLVEHIRYNIAEGGYDTDIFTLQKTVAEYEAGQETTKHILDRVFTDSGVERDLARDMDAAEEVVVYAKLPKAFYIPTPVGDYSPDWAIAFKKSGIKHIYFIAETKGSLNSLGFTGDDIQDAKIACAMKLFNEMSSSNVRYGAITDYSGLLQLVRGTA